MRAGLAAIIILMLGAMASLAQETVPAEPASVADLLEDSTNLPSLILHQLTIPSQQGWVEAVEAERARLLTALVQNGYLDAVVEVDPGTATTGSGDIELSVAPGERYTIGAVDIIGVAQPTLLGDLEDVAASVLDEPAQALIGETLADRLIWRLGQEGYAFPSVEVLEFSPTGDPSSARLSIRVDTGELSFFTEARTAKVDAAQLAWVTEAVPFRPGDVYSVDRLAQFRDLLLASGNVDRARVEAIEVGTGRFVLDIRYQKVFQLPAPNLQVDLGVTVLMLTLLVLGWRLVVSANHPRHTNTVLLDITSATLLTVSAVVVGTRVASFLPA
jgi:hypothetical protein